MKKDIDDILKQALTPANEPSFWLNQKILNQAKETKGMEKKNYKKIAVAALSAMLVLGLGSATVYAAWQYLAPDAVTEEMQEMKIADAFQGEDGLNELFELPIDASKADPEAAEKYLESLELREEAEIEETDIDKWMKGLTAENIDEKAMRVESTVQVLTPDEKGMISYEYELEGRGGGEGTFLVKLLFEEDEYGMLEPFGYHYSDADKDSLAIETFTKNEDGTITFAVYIPK